MNLIETFPNFGNFLMPNKNIFVVSEAKYNSSLDSVSTIGKLTKFFSTKNSQLLETFFT